MQGALVSLWQLVSFCGGFCIICIYYTTAIGQQAVLLPTGIFTGTQKGEGHSADNFSNKG